MKKVILSLLLAGGLVFCSACAQNAPAPVSTPAAQSAEPAPVSTPAAQSAEPAPVSAPPVQSAEPAPESNGDGADIVEPYPAAMPKDAVKFLELMPPKAFGFAEPFDAYEVNFVEEVLVEGSDCYRMELEVAYSDGVEVLTLFIRTDLGVMYHYDDESGSYHEITPYDYYCPQESPESSDEGPQGYPEGGEDTAIACLMRYSKDELDLPAELGEYVMRLDGETEIKGIRCYDIGVYADLGSRMELMGTYYVAFDNSVVFATDLQTGGYKALAAK